MALGNFGKALFIGTAYSAGAGSVVTLTGKDIGFFELTFFTFPVGWSMVFLIWLYFMLFLNRSAIMLTGTILFFLLRILTIKDLEEIPWNIILLFSGAMSSGFCLWKTGAAQWMAVMWLKMFEGTGSLVFLLGVTLLVLTLTNFIMNVADISITLPVALIMASYLNRARSLCFS